MFSIRTHMHTQAMNVLLINKLSTLPQLLQYGVGSALHAHGAVSVRGEGCGAGEWVFTGAGAEQESQCSMSMWCVGVWKVAPVVEQMRLELAAICVHLACLECDLAAGGNVYAVYTSAHAGAYMQAHGVASAVASTAPAAGAIDVGGAMYGCSSKRHKMPRELRSSEALQKAHAVLTLELHREREALILVQQQLTYQCAQKQVCVVVVCVCVCVCVWHVCVCIDASRTYKCTNVPARKYT